MTHRIARAWLCAGGLWLPFAAHAIGTAAGTEIRNQAEISFVLNGSVEIRQSNSTTLRVLELLDVNLLAQTPERVVDAGEPAAPLLFTLTNTGNGTGTFCAVRRQRGRRQRLRSQRAGRRAVPRQRRERLADRRGRRVRRGRERSRARGRRVARRAAAARHSCRRRRRPTRRCAVACGRASRRAVRPASCSRAWATAAWTRCSERAARARRRSANISSAASRCRC